MCDIDVVVGDQAARASEADGVDAALGEMGPPGTPGWRGARGHGVARALLQPEVDAPRHGSPRAGRGQPGRVMPMQAESATACWIEVARDRDPRRLRAQAARVLRAWPGRYRLVVVRRLCRGRPDYALVLRHD